MARYNKKTIRIFTAFALVAVGTLAVLVLRTFLSPPSANPASFDFFTVAIEPILERRCAGCHGFAVGAPPAPTPPSEVTFNWRVDGWGRLVNREEAKRIFHHVVTTVGSSLPAEMDFSHLLATPLGNTATNSPHPVIFTSPADPDYQRFREWFQTLGSGPSKGGGILTPAANFFATEVHPILVRKGCFGCHGPVAFNDLKLNPGQPGTAGIFSPVALAENRDNMKGGVTRLVHLAGKVEQSRQILKNIPIEAGGIPHKGGNHFLEVGDPDFAKFRHWLELERKAAGFAPTFAGPASYPLLFLHRPYPVPRRFLGLNEFRPGDDLYLLEPGGSRNLTSQFHPGHEVEIGRPDISYDATRVLFPMRSSASSSFDIFELDIRHNSLRRITFAPDPTIHHLDPIYVPAPFSPVTPSGEAVVFVSNRAGEFCQTRPEFLCREAEGGTRNEIHDAEAREAPNSWVGARVSIVRGTNTGFASIIARHQPGIITLRDSAPLPFDSTTHYLVEGGVATAAKMDLYRMDLALMGREFAAYNASSRRITYSPEQVRSPAMRSSGEIMFTALRQGWQDSRPFFNGAIYRTHFDGSNFHVHNGNRSGVPILAENRELPNGLEVRIGMGPDSLFGGSLILSDHQFGPNIETRNPLDNLDHPGEKGEPIKSSLPLFFPGWLPLKPEIPFQGLSPAGAFHDGYPTPDGAILAAFASGPVDLNDPLATPDFDIYLLKPAPSFFKQDGFGVGSYTMHPVLPLPGSQLYPRFLAPRQHEPLKKGLVSDPALFGPAKVAKGVARFPAETPSLLQVNSLPLLEAFFEQVTPMGVRHARGNPCWGCATATAPATRVAQFRVVGLKNPAIDGHRFPAILAEGPLAADGSLFLKIPSGTPFDIQALDGLGMAISQPQRWLYALPGEKHILSIPPPLFPQTCGGCHGSFTGEPTDALPRVDGTTGASRVEAVFDTAQKIRRRPTNWEQPLPQLKSQNLFRDVYHSFQNSCGNCHGRKGEKTFFGASPPEVRSAFLAFSAVPRYPRARESHLIERLFGQELSHPAAIREQNPHPSQNPLERETLAQWVRWLDAGAPFEPFGTP